MRTSVGSKWSLVLLLAAAAGCASSSQRSDESAGQVKSRPAEQLKLAPTPAEITVAADAAFKAQDWSVAEGAYERLLDFEPQLPRTWMRLGHCRMALHKYPEAIAAFEQVKSGPALPIARYDIACALALQDQIDAAFDALDLAVVAGFNDANTLANDPDLASLRADERFASLLANVRNLAPKKYEPPAEARQFDFWVGEWNVLAPTGAQAGTSKIEKTLNGCVLIEHWSSAGGQDGKSFNVYDPKKKEWRQHWLDDAGVEAFYVGAFADKCMTLTSEESETDGHKKLHRMRFFDQGSEGVRQWGEVSTDGGANWTTEYDLLYRRK